MVKKGVKMIKNGRNSYKTALFINFDPPEGPKGVKMIKNGWFFIKNRLFFNIFDPGNLHLGVTEFPMDPWGASFKKGPIGDPQS